MELTDDVDKDGSVDLDTAELDPTPAPVAHAEPTPAPPPPVAPASVAAPVMRPAASRAAQPPLSPHGIPTPNATSPEIILRGRYVLEGKIGEGGTSFVYRARDLRRDASAPGGQRVALKLLRPGLRNHPKAVERLKREFHHGQTLSHPAIARVYDVDCESGAWFLTLELLEGETLAAQLQRNDESLSPRRVLEILRTCGDALAFAHERGVVHGDFKPGNVYVTTTGQVRVLDFGSASASWLNPETAGTTATPAYASPEVLSGQRPERRDDVFSFACMAYELLTRKHPFDRRSSLDARNANRLPERDWNLTARQWHVLETGLAWTREERPGSIRALLADLTATEATSPLIVPELRESAQPFGRPRLAPFSVVAALAALAAVVFVASWQLDDVPGVPDVMEGTQRVVRELANLPASPAEETSQQGSSAQSAAPLTPNEPTVQGETTSRLAMPSKPRRSADHARRQETASGPSALVRSRSVPPTISPSQRSGRNPSRLAEPSATTGSAYTWNPSFSATTLSPYAGDEESPPGTAAYVSFDVDSIAVSEGATSAVLRINRRHQLSGRAVVQWRTLAGSAKGGEDYREVASGIAEFADGQSQRAIYVPLLNDLDYERDETFTVELYAPNGLTKINPIARATVTVRDNDGANEFRLADQSTGANHAQ